MRKGKKILILCGSITGFFVIIGIVVFNQGQQSADMTSIGYVQAVSKEGLLSMGATQVKDKIEKEGFIFIQDSANDYDGIYEEFGKKTTSYELCANQELIGLCMEQRPDSSIIISEVVAQPMGTNVKTLRPNEKKCLLMDGRIQADHLTETAFSYDKIYFVFYGRTRDSGIRNLGTAKLALSLDKVKDQNDAAYDRMDCVFELYCSPGTKLDNYGVAIRVPRDKRYTLLDESYFTLENTERDIPFEVHEIMNRLGVHSLQWIGYPLADISGAAYKITPATIVKTNAGKSIGSEVSWSLEKLGLKQRMQTFELGGSLMLERNFKNHTNLYREVVN